MQSAGASEQNRRILVIDDNPAIHQDFRRVLAGPSENETQLLAEAAELFSGSRVPTSWLPFEITSAFQGAEALALVRAAVAEQRPYALAVVDLRMPPGWDGVETISQISKADPEMQIVICSAFSDLTWPEIMERLPQGDGLLILRKPFDMIEIRQIAQALVTNWTLRRHNAEQVRRLEGLIEQRTDELTRANEALRRENERRDNMEIELRLAHKLEAVGQLAAGIAHELNTPIQFVADSVAFLRDASNDMRGLLLWLREQLLKLSGDRRDIIEAIRLREEEADFDFLAEEIPRAFERTFEGTRRVTSIVRALKEFAHPDLREKSAANLNQAIQNTLIVCRNEYKYVATVETEFAELPPVLCHVGDLNQVFLNLIVNAAHAIGDVVGKSGNLGRIKIQTDRDGPDVVVTISDTGGGIPTAIQDRVYDPFFTTKPVGKGTGQGLAIARSIVVDKHQGSISFMSEQGHGTTFTIRLPTGGELPVPEV